MGTKLQIGSDAHNQIVLLDPQVAPVHATLWEQQGRLYLLDGSGGSATHVNQAPVRGTVGLQMGDRIDIGGTIFMVDDLNAQMAAAAPAAKKGFGCGRWLLVGACMFIVEVVLLAAAGFIIYQTDVELRGGLNDLSKILSQQPAEETPPTGTDQPGPAILSLTDIWIQQSFSGGFSQHDERTVEGVSPDGEPIKTSFVRDFMEQATPEWQSYEMVKQTKNDQIIAQFESGIVKDVVYSGTSTCAIAPDSNTGLHVWDQTPESILNSELAGHVKLVEAGVTMNGVITDRYEIRRDNILGPEALIAFQSGSLYRARDGGYLVQLEYIVKLKAQSRAVNMGDDYSATEPSLVTYHFDRSYVADGTMTAKVPEVCKDKVK